MGERHSEGGASDECGACPTETVSFIDQYCALYHDLFPDVRSFEHFKLLHLGLVAELPRKSLPAIACS
jgi:SRSO17 transposase